MGESGEELGDDLQDDLRYFDDYEIGQVLTSSELTISEEESIAFAKEWDPQPFHIDKAAAEASLYGGLTCCTAHIFSVTSKLGGLMRPKLAAIAGLGFRDMHVHLPMRPGDTVHFTTECTRLRRSKTKPDRGIIQTRTKLFNQREEVVFSSLCDMMVRTRPTT